MSIKELGILFKETKDEIVFTEIYERLKRGVIGYYTSFGKTQQIVEDAFHSAMVSIWTDIDKLNVDQYSISTTIYLKTKQNIIRQNASRAKSTGDGGEMFGEEYALTPMGGTEYYRPQAMVQHMNAQKFHDFNLIEHSAEISLIKREKVFSLMNVLEHTKFGDYLRRHYFGELRYHEMAKEDNVPIQTIKNRIYFGKIHLREQLRSRNLTRLDFI